MTPEQLEQAACAGMGTTLFFSDDHHDNARAKQVCDRCLVRQPCLDAALADPDNNYGIAGGYTARERWRLQRGLEPTVALGRKPTAAKAHGTRWRFMQGCTCDDCLAAERDYQRQYHAEVRRPRRLQLVDGSYDPQANRGTVAL